MSRENDLVSSGETKEDAEARRRVFRPVPASFVFVFNESLDQLLLHRRQNTHFLDGFLDVPSGHEEPEETPKLCAMRELKEETKLVYSEEDLTLFALYSALQPEVDYRYSAYFVQGLSGQVPVIGEPGKCSEMGMFDVDKILSGEITDVSPLVTAILRGYIDFAETGRVSEKTFNFDPNTLALDYV